MSRRRALTRRRGAIFGSEIQQLAGAGLTVLITTHYMDEAERCNRVAYISYGNLLASGTVDEVVKNSEITTWEVAGGDLHELARKNPRKARRRTDRRVRHDAARQRERRGKIARERGPVHHGVLPLDRNSIGA